MFYQRNQRGVYILRGMEVIALSGDAYATEDELYKVCHRDNRYLTYSAFREDLHYLLKEKYLYLEGRRLYTTLLWRYEQSAAKNLTHILKAPFLCKAQLPEKLEVNDVQLTEEQRSAVELALSNRLSLILGGAGSGKTTLVRAIMDRRPSQHGWVLCAPTGKAARNLTDRTGFQARTVHSALGMRPDEDFLSPIAWAHTDLVIVDEASMMTIEMLAGMLCRAPDYCRIVLLGDPNQLLSVGAGNVIPDLLELGVPSCRLECSHRQSEASAGLTRNVTQFPKLLRAADLSFDDSFQMRLLPDPDIQGAVCEEAAKRYLAGESVQLLSPFNTATELSVAALNRVLQPRVNPHAEDTPHVAMKKGPAFWNGDRVMITKNDRDRGCYNGDIGRLFVYPRSDESPRYSVLLSDGRFPTWETSDGLRHLTLAYAITVHKSQGSEYDTVLMPVARKFSSMMIRNLLYTAISRAKKQVILFGELETLDTAMQCVPRKRRSMLVPKTRMALRNAA